MLTDREAFKFGFLLRCADEGLTTEEIQARIKTAAERLEKRAFLGIPVGAALGAAKNLGLLGLGVGGVAGLAGGYGLGAMTSEDMDPEEAKRQELIATYQQQADRIRRAMRSRQYRTASKPRRPSLVA